MKNLLAASLALSLISIVFVILYFLASTDIYHEYIGTTVISNGIIKNADKLPGWTTCKGEWGVLKIDLVIRIVFLSLVTVTLTKLINSNNKRTKYKKFKKVR